MTKAIWISLLTIGLLWSAACIADDVQDSTANGEPLQVVSLSLETILEESVYPSRWRLIHPTASMAYSDDWPRPIANFDFQDAGALSRIGELRGLSLLTLAEFGQTRLFLGLNKKGLAGLHFDLVPRYGAERHLEVVRMPYLRNTSRAAD